MSRQRDAASLLPFPRRAAERRAQPGSRAGGRAAARAAAIWTQCGLAALALLLSAGSARAACDGDCDGDGTVRIDELVTAVAVALGDPLGRCTAADRSGDGTVSIDELVAAVGSALDGCGADPGALRASTSVATAPLATVLDFGTVGGGGAGAGLRAARRLARPAQISGCITNPCLLFGGQTGTEEVCCLGTQYSVTDVDCAVNDADGNIVNRNGSFTLDSPTADVCSGAIPVGESFTAQFNAVLTTVKGASGDFATSRDDYVETFDVSQPGCGTTQPDTFGFAVRGDGIRYLNGTRHLILGDPSSVVADLTSRTDGLSIVVTSSESGDACNVLAGIAGSIEVVDGLTGSDVVTTYDGLGVSEERDGSDLLLSYEGSVETDCLGQVSITTTAPMRLREDQPCPLGGAVRLELDAGSVDVTYTQDGGVELDFGADGSIDQRVDRCEQLEVEQCTFQPPSGVCDPCTYPTDCAGGQQCYTCTFGCDASAASRCSQPDDFVTCADGVY